MAPLLMRQSAVSLVPRPAGHRQPVGLPPGGDPFRVIAREIKIGVAVFERLGLLGIQFGELVIVKQLVDGHCWFAFEVREGGTAGGMRSRPRDHTASLLVDGLVFREFGSGFRPAAAN